MPSWQTRRRMQQPKRDASCCKTWCIARPGAIRSRDPGSREHDEQKVERTSDDLGALKVLVGVKVAWRQGEPEPDQDQKKVCSPPHGEVTSRSATATFDRR